MDYSYQDALAFYGIGGAHPGGLTLTKQILKNEKLNEATKILDAGCGTGQTSAFLAKTYKCDVTAVDSHPIMIQKAKERFNYSNLEVKVIESSVESLPFKDESFDYIISESVVTFTNIKKTLPEYFRVLKNNGILISTDMTAEKSFKEEDLLKIKEVYSISNVLTEEQWLTAFQTAGFRKANVILMDTLYSHLLKETDHPEFKMSSYINPKLTEILFKHQQITNSFSKKIGYRTFKSIK
ncbi:methyltransferase [Heyndrickxia sporothermodurans]|nr:methyltransferase [Heyndrickxia sporothermodurans]